MFIHEIFLSCFRNYDHLHCTFDHRFNMLIGSNGQGKTNFLEAIYFAYYLKSFRALSTKELIQKEKSQFIIQLLFSENKVKQSFVNKLLIKHSKNKKEFFLNQKKAPVEEVKKEQIKILLLNNDDVLLTRAFPYERRAYFDTIIGILKPEYYFALKQFKKLLVNRNLDLKRNHQASKWDQSMAQFGSKIINARISFLKAIENPLVKIFHQLTLINEKASISYRCVKKEERAFGLVEVEDYLLKLKETWKQDQLYKKTHFGPHLDDFIFFIGDSQVKINASQGESRLFSYALKFSIFEYICHFVKKAPLLLLDDIFSDLDPKKIDLFFQFIKKGSQVFLACANLDLIKSRTKDFKIHQVSKGIINP